MQRTISNPFQEQTANQITADLQNLNIKPKYDAGANKPSNSESDMTKLGYVTAEGFGKQTKVTNNNAQKANPYDKENNKVIIIPLKGALVEDSDIKFKVSNPVAAKILGPEQNLVEEEQIKKDDNIEEAEGKCGPIQSEQLIKGTDIKNEPTNHAEIIAQTFRDRCKAAKVEQLKNMVLSDQLEYKDPQALSEFSQDIFQSMIKEEEIHKINPHDYLQKVQTDIKDTQRAFLLEWIIDVHRKFRLQAESLFVAQYIIDKFLSIEKIKNKELHLLGVATLLISSKYEEIYPPDLRDLLAVSENKFKKDEVLAMEKRILITLDFKITSPSAYRFLQRYRRITPSLNDDEVFFYAQYILEISLLEASFLRFKPSKIAAACLILSAKQLKKVDAWNQDMIKFTGYSEKDVAEAVKEVKLFAHEINPKFISILKYKFSKSEYMKVANYQFKF